MDIVVHNTLTGKKEPLQTKEPGKAGVYVCGVTVYDHCHIGHARVMVAFDVIVRHLRARGYDVTYVRNFTDIDDKIIRRAAEKGIDIGELTDTYIEAFHADMAALGVAPADVEPRATDHLDEMQRMIGQLIDKKLAYARDGEVYYAVRNFAGYGKLSGKRLEDQESGARVAVDERKNDPLDFALWKGAKPEEPQWPSPWGSGRPGWHIECSAMSSKYLGAQFDIHGGGRDLIFPHHENEIAQSEGAHGHSWVRYWLHNGFVNVVSDAGEREKMSKSLGNFHTIQDLLQVQRGETLRLFILNSHYRSPLDFSNSLLKAADAGLDRLYGALRNAEDALGHALPAAMPLTQHAVRYSPFKNEADRFFAAMDDDFNTPKALAALFDIAKQVNRAASRIQAGEKQRREDIREGARVLRGLGAILGIALRDPASHFSDRPGEATPETETNDSGLTSAHIESLIADRAQARAEKRFADADQIRDDLLEQGITLLDGKDGTSWRQTR